MNRNNGIDFLRGFSILTVMLLHCNIHMPLPQNFLPQKLTNLIFRSGYYGVIIFFVISGFLITTTALKRWGSLQNISVNDFYKIRFARIVPCLVALLLFLSVLNFFQIKGFIVHTTSLLQALFAAVTFHINWLEAKTGYLPGSWDILWSLSVEEMFYLFFPLVCLICRKQVYFILIMFAFILLGPFARTVFYNNEMWSDHSYLSCMDAIAIGCLSALFTHHFNLNKRGLLIVSLCGISSFLFIFVFGKQAYQLGITKVGLNVTLLACGIGMILISMHEWYTKRKRESLFKSNFIRWLGTNSYEIYLTHGIIITFFSNILFNADQSIPVVIMWYILILVLSGIIGQFITTFFSAPMNKSIRNLKIKSANENLAQRIE